MQEQALQKSKKIYCLAALVVILSGASAYFGLLSYLFFGLFSAAFCALLFRFFHFGAAAVPPILAAIITCAFFGFTPDALLLSVLPATVGLVLSLGIRRGEDRVSLSVAAAAVSLLLLLACAILLVREAAGERHLLSFVMSSLDALKAELVALQMESYREAAALLAENGLALTLPTESAISQAISQAFALIPSAMIVICLGVGMFLTYLLSFLAGRIGDARLFDGRNAAYTLSPLAAGAYLLLEIFVLVYTDFSSPLSLVCINTAEVLTPLFAFGAVLGAPRLFAFIRHMSYSKFDYIVWVILLVLCVLFYFSTMVTLLAVWQALHILISALRARKNQSGV